MNASDHIISSKLSSIWHCKSAMSCHRKGVRAVGASCPRYVEDQACQHHEHVAYSIRSPGHYSVLAKLAANEHCMMYYYADAKEDR